MKMMLLLFSFLTLMPAFAFEPFGGSLYVEEQKKIITTTCQAGLEGRCISYNIISYPVGIPTSMTTIPTILNQRPLKEEEIYQRISILNLHSSTVILQSAGQIFERSNVGTQIPISALNAQKLVTAFIYGASTVDFMGEWKESGFTLYPRNRIYFEANNRYQVTVKVKYYYGDICTFPLSYKEENYKVYLGKCQDGDKEEFFYKDGQIWSEDRDGDLALTYKKVDNYYED